MHISRDHVPIPDRDYHRPDAAHPAFDYTPAGPVELSEPTDALQYHDVLPLTYSSSGHNGHRLNRVEGLYLRSHSPGAKKLLIVVPIWGTSTYPPEKIAYGYANRSKGTANVIWLFGETPLFPWDELSTVASEAAFIRLAEDSAEHYRTAVIDHRRLLDWVETRSEIDTSRVAIVGFSMGALTTATLLGNDPRVSAAVLMMGGAELGNIFATCDDRPGDVREHVLKTFAWTIDDYRDFFADLFAPAEPVRYAGRYDPARLLMIDAAFDDCMPSSSRDALWRATGQPERLTLLHGHRGAFYAMTPLGLNFLRRRIYRFLDNVL